MDKDQLKQHILDTFLKDVWQFRMNIETERRLATPDDEGGKEAILAFFVNPYQNYTDCKAIHDLLGVEPPTMQEFYNGDGWIGALTTDEDVFCEVLERVVALPGVAFRIGGTDGDGSDYCLWVMFTDE